MYEGRKFLVEVFVMWLHLFVVIIDSRFVSGGHPTVSHVSRLGVDDSRCCLDDRALSACLPACLPARYIDCTVAHSVEDFTERPTVSFTFCNERRCYSSEKSNGRTSEIQD